MHEVTFDVRDVAGLAELVGDKRWSEVSQTWESACADLAGKTVWHINATANGGGVAEMLLALMPLWRRLGMDARWLVLDGDPEFFAITKRLHNFIHGFPGDGGQLEAAERRPYEATLGRELATLREWVAPGDVVVLHDPQTAGLAAGMAELGATVIWRSHIGRDEPNELTDAGWAFLEPYIAAADRVVVSRLLYKPPSVPLEKVVVITPCIDTFTAKNIDITPDVARDVLVRVGLLEGEPDGEVSFPRRDGSPGTVRRHTDIAVAGGALPAEARLVLQVSRWDRLKDMPGVMTGFVEGVYDESVNLALCGPAVEAVSDDPEGAEVLAECIEAHAALPEAVRRRVHLFCVPMDDVDENAYIVNALQRYADIVVQKSIFEGFGLTVTEAMWKGKPLVASAVGGIQDQIDHGIDGMLLPDPTDLAALGDALTVLLRDDALATRLGEAARQKVLMRFLGDGSLFAYARLITDLVASKDPQADPV